MLVEPDLLRPSLLTFQLPAQARQERELSDGI